MLSERMLVLLCSGCGWRKRPSGKVRSSKCME